MQRLRRFASFIVSLGVAQLIALSCAAAQDTTTIESPPDVDAAATASGATVVVDGIELFRVSGSASLPSAERARAVSARIADIARQPAISAKDIVIQRHDTRLDIVAAGRHIIAVVASDAELEGAQVADVADFRASRIREAVERYRAERQTDSLMRAGLAALAATAGTLIALMIIVRVSRRASQAIERRYRERVHSITVQSVEVVRAESIWRAVSGTINALRLILVFALAYVCLTYTLSLFPWTRQTSNELAQLVGGPLHTMGSAILQYIPKLMFLILLALAVRYALKLLNVFSHAVAVGRVPVTGFDAEWARPTYNIVRTMVVLLAIVVAYPYLPGSGSAAFQGLSLFVGLMLSLGASSAMASIIAGYTVTYRRAFRVGDRITIGDFTGEVTQIRLLVTHLRTPKNEEVVVPNSTILQSHVVNYSKLAQDGGLILHTTVDIGYDTPWRHVEAMLLQAAQRTEGLLKTPPPFVLEKALGQFAVTYEINVYVGDARAVLQRYAALHRNILDVFGEHGVQIMTPAYEGDPEIPKVARPAAPRPEQPEQATGHAPNPGPVTAGDR